MIIGPITGGIRRPENLTALATIYHLAALGSKPLHPDPAPDARRSLSLVDDARAEVHHALPLLTCLTLPPGTIVRKRVMSWTQVQDIAWDGGGELIDACCVAPCDDAPMAAAVVAAWRGLAVAALDYRDGRIAWQRVTDAAERFATFIRRACAAHRDPAGF